MADEELAYLQPDFDPSSLTVPRLRSILVAHNVAYPSSAKKSDLVNLFNIEVVPQARKLLNAQSRTKRSTRGIVDVPSSQESNADPDDDDEDENLAPATTPARRSTRRSTRLASEDIVEATPRPSRRSVIPPPSTAKRASSKHARIDEEDGHAEERHVKRQAQPRTTRRAEEPADAAFYQGPESPFTKDNPFQSGTSPPSAARSKSGERRRTTLGTPSDRERRKSRDARRRTDGYGAVEQDDGYTVPSRSTFDMPGMSVRADDVPAGEDFTAEERQDLVKAERSGETSIVRRPRRRQQQKSGLAKAAPWTVLVAMLGGVATVFRQEKLQVGYCGVGEASSSLAGVEIPEWASFLQPQCEPCPQHAYCYPELRTVCEPDFILTHHPLSLGGVLPLAPTCEPDSEKVRRIKTVADVIVEQELRTRNAQYECGETISPDVSEPDLKQTLSARRSKRMTDEEFNELWGPAIGEVVGREEVETRISEGQENVRFLRSTSLARVPLSCAVRRSLRLAIRQNLSRLVALIALSLTAVYGRHALTTRRSTTQQAKKFAALALDKLAMQASLHAEDAVGYPDPYISMVALRDDVLREEFRTKERTRLWEVVKGLVEGNANVRTMVREGRTGDVSRVWEWIGAVQRIEGSARRQSGAIGKLVGSPGRLLDFKSEEEAGSGVATPRKWEEGKPYF